MDIVNKIIEDSKLNYDSHYKNIILDFNNTYVNRNGNIYNGIEPGTINLGTISLGEGDVILNGKRYNACDIVMTPINRNR